MLQRVTTKYGVIRGENTDYGTVFKGIPYAKAPVGELRFKRPEEPDAFDGEYAADHFRARCIQAAPEGFYKKEFYDDPAFLPEESEDCLYLNIWTPAESTEERLPVAFWIHGGAFMNGFGSELEFDGEAFAKKGVILVTINYRLNIFGFFAHPWLSEESEESISGNYGIFDQLAALRWVRENIAAFGGDPDRITIFGQSAGCMSVQTILSSPLSEGLVSGAVMQSAAGYRGGLSSDFPMAEAEKAGTDFCEMFGIESLAALRRIPASELYRMMGDYSQARMAKLMEKAAEMKARGEEMDMLKEALIYKPAIDGVLLTEGYEEVLENGHFPDLPYIAGSCKNDIGAEPGSTDGEHMLFHGTQNLAKLLHDQGHKPVFVYRFDRQMPGDEMGAFHSSELWYVFGTYGRCWRPLDARDAALSEEMVSCWTNFMKAGDPNGEGLPEWKAYTGSAGQVRFFDVD